MKLVLKILLALVLFTILAVGGCAALVGGAVSEVDKQMKEEQAAHSLTPSEFKEIKTGIRYKEFVSTYGEPDPDQTQKVEVEGMKNRTVYYNVAGGEVMDMYQFSFTNGKLSSKAKY